MGTRGPGAVSVSSTTTLTRLPNKRDSAYAVDKDAVVYIASPERMVNDATDMAHDFQKPENFIKFMGERLVTFDYPKTKESSRYKDLKTLSQEESADLQRKYPLLYDALTSGKRRMVVYLPYNSFHSGTGIFSGPPTPQLRVGSRLEFYGSDEEAKKNERHDYHTHIKHVPINVAVADLAYKNGVVEYCPREFRKAVKDLTSFHKKVRKDIPNQKCDYCKKDATFNYQEQHRATLNETWGSVCDAHRAGMEKNNDDHEYNLEFDEVQ